MSKKINRRELLKSMAMVSGAAVLTAFKPAAVTPPSAPAQDAATIDYWTPAEDLGGQNAIIEKFTAEKKIKVNHTFVPLTAGTQASEKLLASIAGGKPPDAAYFDRFLIASWAARDALMDITSLAAANNVKKEDFLAHTWAEAVYCNKLYGIPTTTDGRALFVNNKFLKEKGLKAPESWKDLDTLQTALTDGNTKDGYKRIGHIPWYPWLAWMLYIWAMTNEGVDVWDFKTNKCTVNTEPWLQAASWMVGYAKKYDVVSMESFGSQFGGDLQDPFGNGLLAMQQHGNWMLNNYKRYFPNLDYDVVPMPGPAKMTGRNLAGGWSVVIPKGVKKSDIAIQFLAYFTSEPAQYIYYRDNKPELVSTEIPTRVKVAKDNTVAYASHPKAGAFLKSLEAQYIRPPIPEAQLLFEELGKATDLIVHLSVDPKEALDKVAKKVDDAMAKWKC